MDMDQSLRDTLNQLVSLQAQQLSAINALASSSRGGSGSGGGGATPQFNNSYMNYAPDYMPPMMAFSQGTHQAQQNFNNYANYAQGNQSFSDRFFENKSKVSYQQSGEISAERGARYGNALIAGGGLAASAAADVTLMGMVPGLVGSVAAGAAGGAAAGWLFDVGLKQNQQHMAYNQYLQRESYRFIAPQNSTNERGIAGFGQDDRFAAAKYLRHFNTEALISDKETTMLMEKFTEGGLLKGTKDLEGFKDKMKSLTKYVKESALLLNESFEDITKLMSDMKKAGIDVTNVDYFSSKSKVVGAFTGMSAKEAGNFAFGTAVNAVQGTKFGAENEQYKRFDNLLYMGGLFDKATDLKDKDPQQRELWNQINNLGGIKEASAVTTEYQNAKLKGQILQQSAVNFLDYDKSTNRWNFNRESYNEFIKSDKNIDELNSVSRQKLLASGSEGQKSWKDNVETTLRNNLDAGGINDLEVRVMEAKKKITVFKNQKLSLEQLLSLIEHDNSGEGQLWAAQEEYRRKNGADLKRKSNAYGFQETFQAQLNAQRSGFGYKFKNEYEKTKDYIGDAATVVTEPIVRATTAVTDWWYGQDYKIDKKAFEKGMTPADIESGSKEISRNLINDIKKELSDAKNRGYTVKTDVLDKVSGVENNLTSETVKTVGSGAKLVSNKSFTQAGMKDLYALNKEVWQDYMIGAGDTTLENAGIIGNTTSLFNPLTENRKKEIRETGYSALAKSWGMSYDGTSKSYQDVSKKMNTEAERIDKMMKDFTSASAENKGNTEWAKLDIGERQGLFEVRRTIDLLRNEKVRRDYKPYETDEDKRENAKIQRIGTDGENYKYNPNQKGEGGHEAYMTWSTKSGKISYELPGGKRKELEGKTYGDIVTELKKNIASEEEESKATVTKVNAMASGKGVKFTDSGDESVYSDIVKGALNQDEKSIKALNEAHKREGKRDPNSDTFKTLNTALYLVNKSNAPSTENSKKLLSDIESQNTRLDTFGRMASTIVGAVHGSEGDATKFMKDFTGKQSDISNLEVGGEQRVKDAGMQYMANTISTLKGDQKGIDKFIDNLKTVDASTKDQVRSTLTEAFSGNVNEQATIKKAIEQIMAAQGSSVSLAGDVGKNTKDATDVANGDKSIEDLKTESKKLIQNVNEVAQIFKDNNDKLAPKVGESQAGFMENAKTAKDYILNGQWFPGVKQT